MGWHGIRRELTLATLAHAGDFLPAANPETTNFVVDEEGRIVQKHLSARMFRNLSANFQQTHQKMHKKAKSKTYVLSTTRTWPGPYRSGTCYGIRKHTAAREQTLPKTCWRENNLTDTDHGNFRNNFKMAKLNQNLTFGWEFD